MDTKTEARVETIVEDLVEDRKMFTAFDVTKIIRSEVDENVKIYHSEVKRIVDNMWDTMGQFFTDNKYVKTLTWISDNVRAFVYHFAMDDHSQYDPDALPEEKNNKANDWVRSTSVPVDMTGFSKQVDDYVNDDVDDDDPVVVADDKTNFRIMPDNRGRICVPKEAIQAIAIGLKPGDTVYVHDAKHCVIMDTITLESSDALYIIDKSHNVRIGLNVFKKAGMDINKIKSCGVYCDIGDYSIVLSQD